MRAKSPQSRPTLCNSMDCSLPGSSVHGILQARIWSGLPCPPPGDLTQTHCSYVLRLLFGRLVLDHQRHLESITMNKASGGDGIQAELFQILKYNAVKVLHPIFQQIWKFQQWPQDWKKSIFISVPKNELLHNCTHFTCQQGNAQNPSSQTSAVCEPRISR